jgi:chromosome segregation ATPase
MKRNLLLIVAVVVMAGCDSRQRQMMQRRIVALEDQVDTMMRDVQSNKDVVAGLADRIKKLEDRSAQKEKVFRAFNGELDSRSSKANDYASGNTDVVKRIDALESALAAWEKNANASRRGQDDKVDSRDYEKLVDAHNNLVSSFRSLREKVEELDGCLNSPLGSVRVSPHSWLSDMYEDVKRLKGGL